MNLSARVFGVATFANSFSSSPVSRGRSKRLFRSEFGGSVLGVLLLVFGLALPGLANTFTVTNTNDSGPGSLRVALSSAANGDTINIDATGTLTLTSGELVIGTNVTINGPGTARLAVNGNGQFTVFQVNAGVTAYLDAVTIENAYASQSAGGGINNQGTLTLSYATVTGNIEAQDGANGEGIYNSGTLTLNNSLVSDGISSAFGAGIYNSGTLQVNSSTISDNGGGLPGVGGGGIYNTGTGTVTLSYSTVSGNSVHDGGQGAGIYNGGTLTVINSTLSDNNDFFGTGGGIFNDGTATVTGSTLSGNSAIEDNGGGIVNEGTMTILNSTLSGNSTTEGTDGGAIFNSGSLTVVNSTLSGNSATDEGKGGAIFNSGTLILKSTLLAGQTSGGNCSNLGLGTSTSYGYNLSDDSTCTFLSGTGDQNNSVTAGLSSSGLQNNGGPTQTIALLSTSSAVDAIPPTACTDASGNQVLTDQRGVARPQNSGCDIGAFEFVQFVSPNNLNFGNVKVSRSKNAVVTIANITFTKLSIGVVSFVDVSGNPADFTFHRFCGSGLLPGQSCTIEVRFSPSQSTTETALLNIVTSTPGSALQVPITGTGIE